METAALLTQIREIIRDEFRSIYEPESEYRDAHDSAKYMGMGLRTFDDVSPQIPCYRVMGTGKRLYRLADLDAFMEKWRQVPKSTEQLNALVDGVVGQIMKGRRDRS